MTGWIEIASYGTGIEADWAVSMLEHAGIPARLKGERAGVFGITFQGALAQGLILLVRSEDAEQARDVLGLEEGAGPNR
jgi:hypothetical protein